MTALAKAWAGPQSLCWIRATAAWEPEKIV